MKLHKRALLNVTSFGLAVFLAGCTGVFFQPDQNQYFTPEQAKLDFEDVWIEGRNEQGRVRSGNEEPKLHGWWFPAQLRKPFLATPPEGVEERGTIIFLHGNAQNITAHLASAHWLPKAGYNVFMPDYRGYGQSEGKSSLGGALVDIERALEWLDERGELEPSKKVIVYGQSLGGAMSLLATANSSYKDRIDGVISDSAFSNFRAVTRDTLNNVWFARPLKWPLSWLITGRQKPTDAIAELSPMPVLIIHGDADVAVLPHHADRLYAAANEPKTLWKVPGGRHIQNTITYEWQAAVLEWLALIPASR